ncbi:MAG: methyltransferase [Acidobacteriota bacterium]
MRLGAIPENFIERILLKLGLLPTPLADTQIAFTLARTIMVAAKLGVFEVLASGPLTADEVATRCDTHPRAMKKLLNALVGMGYLRADKDRYALAPVARKWLLKESPQSLHDKMLFQFLEWDWMNRYEDFVRSGEPLSAHETLSEEEWGLYQRGMRSIAGISAPEVAKRTPVPKGARDMLDIGGSHGYYSVALCRRYQDLRAVVLDLPEAVAQAAPILAKEGMDDRVAHRAGDALTDDLGTEAWDLVFMAQLVHHFDDATNRELARRIADALRPGGVFVIQEVIRPTSAKQAGQVGALLDLYFAVTSEAGTWSVEEMADWQGEAGLQPQKPVWFRSLPGSAQQVAIKPVA